ncbi:MAG: hypothetical protein KatS3mg105_3072 [Gemmatales bacterium]|nr:MAG: hypothetical protein KatS3mg105_3072 [Gemmatales bacterium]
MSRAKCLSWHRILAVVLAFATDIVVAGCGLAVGADPDVPKVLKELKPGHWYEVPDSQIRPHVPKPTPPGNPKAIITAWNSGAYDSRRQRLLVTGGGHNDYGGNEIYAFSLQTLQWKRIWGPSKDIPYRSKKSFLTYSDGTPCARHTYDALEYLPQNDSLFLQGGSLFYAGGGGGKDTWEFDLKTLKWSRKEDVSPERWASLSSVSAYDPVTGHIFLAGNGSSWGMHEYDPKTGKWKRRGRSGITIGLNAEIDPLKRKFVAIGRGNVYIADIGTTGRIEFERVKTKGDTDILKYQAPGFTYDSRNRALVAWAGGTDVFVLDLQTLSWKRHRPAPTNRVIPTMQPRQGTYGRFRYAPKLDVIVCVNDIDQNVYIYRLGPIDR